MLLYVCLSFSDEEKESFKAGVNLTFVLLAGALKLKVLLTSL
jgi:hypothetical protein